MEGFYVMYYTGVSGFGHAVFILKNGVICGADAAGGILDGKYNRSESGKIAIEVVLTVPAGTTLVTGQSLSSPFSQTISGAVEESFANGQTVPMSTPMGPVNIIFRKLRDLP